MKKEIFLTQTIGDSEEKIDFSLDESGSLYINNKKL